ncbi:MAG: hypothetical protein AAF570_17560, partial [Bacteroidota bacterium]
MTGAFVLLAWLGVGAYWHTCQVKCLCGSDAVTAPTSDGDDTNQPTPPNPAPEPDPNANNLRPWTARENGAALFSAPGCPVFPKNSTTVELPDAA